MTKRAPGKFVRSPRDLYDTPYRAVVPLIPHLESQDFAEPCSGRGELMLHLEAFGLRCRYEGDIAKGQDALNWTPDASVKVIVTNPPWTWELLQPLIAHFIATGLPVWLLLDADLMHNVRMRPFMRRCFKVVSVGRLRWIPGTPHQGLDNASWYGFRADHEGYSQFVPREPRKVAA